MADVSCNCGNSFSTERLATKRDTDSAEIYKGHEAPPHKYPWMAYIVVDNDDVHCGGTIIDHETIMTAAHCVHDWRDGNDYPPDSIKVYVGHNDRTNLADADLYQVREIIVDSQYTFKYPIEHDFALLKVNHAIAYSDKVSPICIPEENTMDYNRLTVAGWGISGATEDTQMNPSDVMKEAEVDYIPPEECWKMKQEWYDGADKKYGMAIPPPPISDLHLCAFDRKTGAGPCPGDSGGALMYQDANGRYFEVGIVSGSWGNCGQRLAVQLYTKTQMYHNMLKNHTKACVMKLHT
ncbi:hypothetical protein FE257_001111 [Aspergillus nanangensis]|uniref:Peptidase S1 domain-containing protein n=1 Tax=Aspergillus nanangensis TaxID=2582783 RepID=A0AAD4GWF5_ASPNN|nr:hypothetical protein FE257_001111 [Aspergillus nanangensis]